MKDIQDYFISSTELSSTELIAAGITAKELVAIYYDYVNSLEELKTEGIYLSNRLQFCDEINSVRWRTKDPIHLLTKIVRKRKDAITEGNDNSPYLSINTQNYKKIITDLVGLRAIYLFKFQWRLVDEYIFDNFKLSSVDPIQIYHAHEDDLSFYYDQGYEKKVGDTIFKYDQSEKESKYRSTHYIIKPNFPHDFKVEIQIRSILDEAWGEIDHYIRYPDHQNDEILKRKMTILNGAINGCEELATNYITYFQNKNIEVLSDAILDEDQTTESANADEVKVIDDVNTDEVKAIDDANTDESSLENFDAILNGLALENDVSRISKVAFPYSLTDDVRKEIEKQNKTASRLHFTSSLIPDDVRKEIEKQNKTASRLHFTSSLIPDDVRKEIEKQNKTASRLHFTSSLIPDDVRKEIEKQNKTASRLHFTSSLIPDDVRKEIEKQNKKPKKE